MEHDAGAIIGFAVVSMLGLYSALFSRKLAQRACEFYLNVLHVRFNETLYRMMFLIPGILLFVLGIVTLLRTVA